MQYRAASRSLRDLSRSIVTELRKYHRAAGQSLGSATHWIFAALLTTFFPALVGNFAAGYIFLFFCAMMVLQLIWVRTMVPETKGVSLEQIQRQLGVGV